MKSAEQRARKYAAKLSGDVWKQRFDAMKKPTKKPLKKG